jgi:porin
VYNAGEDDRKGVDFALDPEDGVLAIAEAGCRRNQGGGDPGLPGNVTLGGYYDSRDYQSFTDPDEERAGNYGLYLLLDQMVYREGGAGSEQGLTPWAAFTFAPLQRVNTLPLFAAAGLVWQGLFPGRDDDTSKSLRVLRPVQRRPVGPAVRDGRRAQPPLSGGTVALRYPDLQYVIRPGGSDQEPDALVIGAEIGVDF